MTDGEKLVWATAYAEQWKASFDFAVNHGPGRPDEAAITATAAEWASATVDAMRRHQKHVADGWGEDSDVCQQLREMIDS